MTDPHRIVTILLTDMVMYSNRTAGMSPSQLQAFITDYHTKLQKAINPSNDPDIITEPSEGDGSVTIISGEDKTASQDVKWCHGVEAAIRLARLIQAGRLAPTRIGIYVGEILEAKLAGKTVRFGASFSAASRLEELCGYFETPMLMGRAGANSQSDLNKYIVAIGKLTPKNFAHPIHAYTIYMPGLGNLTPDCDPDLLSRFIKLKNEAMEIFSGNRLKAIETNFATACDLLEQAQDTYLQLTGKLDMASERVLSYIREHPYPDEEFDLKGMQLRGKRSNPIGTRLYHLSQEFLKAINREYYDVLVVNTDWEKYFKLEWHKQGSEIIKINEQADGIFYIVNGSVETIDARGRTIITLGVGDIFGEMAYFSKEKKRNATVRASTDTVVRRISGADFERLPVIKKIFQHIAASRQLD
ncbi:MAG: cyclic nucleotide-binding domain-containing protein [Thermodesulfobacteriota bacterium]